MKKFAVVLSGCGVFDGAEIHESVMTLLEIVKHGGTYEIFSPDIDQHHVINHLTGEETGEKRNVLVESARIARGNIKPLSGFKPENFDAIIFPGGFGVAKNLCDFAFKGDDCTVNPEVAEAVRSMAKLGKPIGALCIAPAMISRLLNGVEVTIGNDTGTVAAIEKMGGKHKTTSHGQVVVDHKYKVVTTPCYMLDANILQIAEGAENVVKAILELL